MLARSCCAVRLPVLPGSGAAPERMITRNLNPVTDSAPTPNPNTDPDLAPSPGAQDAELVDYFQNEPTARVWLSGDWEAGAVDDAVDDFYYDDDDDDGEEWGAKRVGRKGKGAVRSWPVCPSRGAAIQKRVPPAAAPVATWEMSDLESMVVDEVALVPVTAHPCVHAAPRVAPASTRAAVPVTSPVGAAETKSAPVSVHYQVQHAAPRVDVEVVEDPSPLPSEPHKASANPDELLDQLLLPRGMMHSVYAV